MDPKTNAGFAAGAGGVANDSLADTAGFAANENGAFGKIGAELTDGTVEAELVTAPLPVAFSPNENTGAFTAPSVVAAVGAVLAGTPGLVAPQDAHLVNVSPFCDMQSLHFHSLLFLAAQRPPAGVGVDVAITLVAASFPRTDSAGRNENGCKAYVSAMIR